MIVISPHIDDAVFSCAEVLAGAKVITICAGIPAPDVPPSHFDRAARFRSAAEAVRARIVEDDRALSVLGAEAVHLNCLDGTYAQGEPLAMAVTRALAHAEPGEVVLGPLGLRHPDHEIVAAAFRATVRAQGLNAWIYEELPYAHLWPEYIGPALMLARVSTGTLARASGRGKRAAVRCYRSQLKGMNVEALFGPERYHRLHGDAELC
jgi:LmbE family N-acetylglucosaminyl deacetylase